jgi:hypothetical protein
VWLCKLLIRVHFSLQAGIMAAVNNGKGVIGVAPEAELFIVRGKRRNRNFDVFQILSLRILL